MRAAIVLLVLSIACGGDPRPTAVKRAKPAGPPPRSAVILYGDAVEVRTRVKVRGPRAIELDLPPGQRYTVRKLGGDAASTRIAGPLPPPTLRNLINSRVTVRTRQGEATGMLTEISDSTLVIRTDGGNRPMPLPADIDVDAPADVPGTVELRATGSGELEVSSWLDQLRWQIGYTAVVDDRRVELQGWLSVSNNNDQPIIAERVAVSLAPANVDGETTGLVIEQPLSIDAGESIALPLFREPLSVTGGLVALFDPVGERLDHEGRRPVSRPSYGATRGGEPAAAEIALEVDLDELGRLPGGDIAVYRRSGALIAVGYGAGFADAAQSSAPLDLARATRAARADTGIGRVVVARSSEVSGRRWQEDYAHDPRRKRLVEEIRVELDNRGDREVVIDVREHLYRGLNWAIIYHNDAGPLVKVGTQEVRFDVAVAPRSKKLVAYRVAYTY